MSIVRELVTRLSFVFDRSNLDKFEKAISSFKFKFSAFTAGITFFGNKILNSFNGIAQATLDTDELARSTGLATEEFIALQKAAEKFRVSPETFTSAFQQLSRTLTEARYGGGQLFDILQKSNRQLNLAPFVLTHDIKGAHDATVRYLQSIDDIQVKLRILRDIYGEGNENGLLNLINAGSAAFYNAAEANREYAKTIVQNKDDLLTYEQQVKSFYNALDRLKQVFVGLFAPLVTQILEGLTGIFSGESFSKAGFSRLEKLREQNAEILQDETEAIRQSIGIGNGGLGGILKRAFSYGENINPFDISNDPYGKFLRDQEVRNSHSNTSTNVITNNFEIAMPPGSPDGEATRIAEMITMSIENAFNEKSREIISNNPAVE